MGSERTNFIVEAFQKVIGRRQGSDERIRASLFLRSQFLGSLRRGEIPIHPKFEWLRKSSRTMLELLLAMAADHEKATNGTGDKVTMADLIDVAQMTMGSINDGIQNGVMDPAKVELLPVDQVEGTIGPPVTSDDVATEEEPKEEESPEPDLMALIKGDPDDEK